MNSLQPIITLFRHCRLRVKRPYIHVRNRLRRRLTRMYRKRLQRQTRMPNRPHSRFIGTNTGSIETSRRIQGK